MCITPPRWALPTPLHSRPLGAEVTKNQRPRSWQIKGGNDLENGKRLTGRSVCSQPGPGGETHVARPPLQRGTGVKHASRPALGSPQPKVPMNLPPGGFRPPSAPRAGPTKHLALEICPGGPRSQGPQSPGGRSQPDSACGVGQEGSHTPRAPCSLRASGTGPAQHDALPTARPSSQAGVEVASSARLPCWENFP